MASVTGASRRSCLKGYFSTPAKSLPSKEMMQMHGGTAIPGVGTALGPRTELKDRRSAYKVIPARVPSWEGSSYLKKQKNKAKTEQCTLERSGYHEKPVVVCGSLSQGGPLGHADAEGFVGGRAGLPGQERNV